MFEQAVEADKIANRWNQYGRASRELSDGLYIFFANPVRRMTFILIGVAGMPINGVFLFFM